MAKDKDYITMLLKDMNGKLQGITEAVGSVNEKVDHIDRRLTKVEKHTDRIPAIEAAIKDQSKQLNDHELRIAGLETAA